MYHHPPQDYEVLLPFHKSLSHTLPSTNYVMFEMTQYLAIVLPPCVDT